MIAFSYDPASLRTRVGLQPNDGSRDADIVHALELSQEMLEEWLDRELAQGERIEQFTHDSGPTLSLRAYPLTGAIDITANDPQGSVPEFHLRRATGEVILDGYNGVHDLSVKYTGGFKEPPGVIMAAIIAAFDVVWAAVYSTTAQSIQGPGAIRSIAVPDVGTVSYFDAKAGSSSGKTIAGVPAVFGSMGELLTIYRRTLV